MNKCKHKNTEQGEHWGYSGPVSQNENPAAHGGVSYTETCRDCGAERAVNANMFQYERGEWSEKTTAANQTDLQGVDPHEQ